MSYQLEFFLVIFFLSTFKIVHKYEDRNREKIQLLRKESYLSIKSCHLSCPVGGAFLPKVPKIISMYNEMNLIPTGVKFMLYLKENNKCPRFGDQYLLWIPQQGKTYFYLFMFNQYQFSPFSSHNDILAPTETHNIQHPHYIFTQYVLQMYSSMT